MKLSAIFVLCTVLITSCSKSEKKEIDTGKEETMYLKEGDNVDPQTRRETNWEEVDVTSPIVRYDEIKSEGIEVRGNDSLSVYAIEETLLFDFDKAEIRESGEEKLEEVVNSLERRHPNGEIAIRGYTDAIGSKNYNKELAEQRAEAVAKYIQQKADVDEGDISVLARGEKNPVASNETEQGRQENRRVEILVRN